LHRGYGNLYYIAETFFHQKNFCNTKVAGLDEIFIQRKFPCVRYVYVVIQVTPGGRASKAGLVAGDYILFVNGEDSKKLKHLQAQQIIKKSIQTVTLVW
jgi:C-terminal processing protease CtpA/Prc